MCLAKFRYYLDVHDKQQNDLDTLMGAAMPVGSAITVLYATAINTTGVTMVPKIYRPHDLPLLQKGCPMLE